MPPPSHPDAPYGEGRHTQPQSEPKSPPQRSGVTLYAMQGRECGQVGMPVTCASCQVPSARVQVRTGDTRTASGKPSKQPAALSQTAKLNVQWPPTPAEHDTDPNTEAGEELSSQWRPQVRGTQVCDKRVKVCHLSLGASVSGTA